MAVDDFIDSHLRERPKTIPEMALREQAEPVTERRGEIPRPVQAGAPAWAPAAPPRPGTHRTEPVPRPQVKTVPMQAVIPARAVPPAPPPPTPTPAPAPAPAAPPDDDEGGGSTMLLTPEQAMAAQNALAAATVGAPPAPPAPAATGHAGTIMMAAVDRPPTPAPRAPLPTNGMDEVEKAWGPVRDPVPAAASPPRGLIQPAEPQGPAPRAAPIEPFPESTYVPPKRKGSPVGLIILGILIAVAAGGVFAYKQGLFSAPPPKASSTAKETSPESTSQAPASPSPTSTAAPTASPRESAAAPASAAATTSASAPAAPSSAPPESAPPPADAKPLLSFEGALTVKSSADAEVVVHGQPVGRTNQRLVVRCGSKNVRLRTEGTKWISEGQHVHVVCMQDTTVTIEPTP